MRQLQTLWERWEQGSHLPPFFLQDDPDLGDVIKEIERESTHIIRYIWDSIEWKYFLEPFEGTSINIATIIAAVLTVQMFRKGIPAFLNLPEVFTKAFLYAIARAIPKIFYFFGRRIAVSLGAFSMRIWKWLLAINWAEELQRAKRYIGFAKSYLEDQKNSEI